MTPERWQQVQAVFAAAVERSAESRGTYLSEVCADDAELRREVESLLASHDSASSRFLESPAGLAETEIQITPPRGSRRLPPGTRLGTYEILSSIGAGGMGEVYRARDHKLQREVAIKVLPESFAYDPDALARFEREAVAVAALSHPNILSIYDFGKQGDIAYAVMELLEGHTLREKLKAGPLAVNLILHYALQIVEGLAAAHAKEIVHRDLKPENLFITKDGRVKILDFGLAKRVERVAAGEETSAPTVEGHTTPGMVMGTLGYMSPEQLLGLDVDHRTDLFSFGVVLYEMVAHKAPFRGNSGVAIADAILHKQPPELTDRNVPPALKAILRKLLEKETEKRYATAADALTDLKALEASLAPGRFRLSKTAQVAMSAGLIVALAAGAWFWRKQSRERWALETAAPEIVRLIDENQFAEAVNLAERARAILPRDSTLEKLWMKATDVLTITTDPPGAAISMRKYGAPDAWQAVGATPIEQFRVPQGIHVWRIAKSGFTTATLVDGPSATWAFQLRPSGSTPAEMVHVAAGESSLGWPYSGSPSVQLPDFLIDRFEVTNADYEKFVKSGGYERPEFWTVPFEKDGRTVPFAEASRSFRDATDRPGPAAWMGGTFPEGEAASPVSGVSWYEASAYAAFAGKSLPTAYEWFQAAQTYAAELIVPGSNFRGTAVRAVGSPEGLSGFGTSDMAGNVKEWCLNENAERRRFILGGGFGNPSYMFGQSDAELPWERRANYGFRCVRRLSALPSSAFARLEYRFRDYSTLRPVSDEVFQAYRSLLTYDRTELDSSIDGTWDSDGWTKERVSFAAAYAGERVPAYLYLPKGAARPLEAIVYFPGAYALQLPRLEGEPLEDERIDFLVRSGRAVVYPIYKGMYERRIAEIPVGSGEPRGKWRDRAIMMSKDLGRTIDYLESRADIDSSKIGYFGFSFGGAMAPVLLAAEPRIRSAVLVTAGFHRYAALPEVDCINYITRVKTPLLMLSARLDDIFPLQASQLPYFRLAGTPEKDKKQVFYDVGHASIPQREIIKESLDWFDRYLGPVQAVIATRSR